MPYFRGGSGTNETFYGKNVAQKMWLLSALNLEIGELAKWTYRTSVFSSSISSFHQERRACGFEPLDSHIMAYSSPIINEVGFHLNFTVSGRTKMNQEVYNYNHELNLSNILRNHSLYTAFN